MGMTINELGVFVHPLADCKSSQIGGGTKIWQFVVVLPGAVIGSDCNINCHCFVEGGVTIGNGVTVKSGVYLWSGTTIEDDVFVGPNATFTNDRWPRSRRRPSAFEGAYVERGASIGGGAVILPGVRIGAGAVVGAGAIVSRDVPPGAVVRGQPSRVVGALD